jgi:hypothetical protein
MISANDNLVDGTFVAEPPCATAGVFDRVGRWVAALGPRCLFAFARFLVESITVGDESTEAYDCSGGGLPGPALSNSGGGGTIVG